MSVFLVSEREGEQFPGESQFMETFSVLLLPEKNQESVSLGTL